MSATIDILPTGEYLVSDHKSELGPFRLRETAESAQRMLNAFGAADQQVERLVSDLQVKEKGRDETKVRK